MKPNGAYAYSSTYLPIYTDARYMNKYTYTSSWLTYCHGKNIVPVLITIWFLKIKLICHALSIPSNYLYGLGYRVQYSNISRNTFPNNHLPMDLLSDTYNCACAGDAGNVSPSTHFKGNRYLAIPAFPAHAQPEKQSSGPPSTCFLRKKILQDRRTRPTSNHPKYQSAFLNTVRC